MILQLKKLIKFEFWPMWLFYIPVGIYGLLLSCKAKSITFFTTVNPSLKFSGSLEYSKIDYLKHLPQDIVPKTYLIDKNIELFTLQKLIKTHKIEFPLIIKPDCGHRGIEVKKVDDFDEIIDFLTCAKRDKFLLQEYIDYPIELGIFFVKTPDGKEKKVTSITSKKFLKIKGDGKSTLKEIVTKNIRAIGRKKELKKNFSDQWNKVIDKGEEILLEPVGNHNRGTEFINSNKINSKELENVMDWVTSFIPEFYYGRIDLKVKSIEDLLNKKMKILEVNGVNSEPTHIYDKNTKLFEAYRDLFYHMNIMYEIGFQNRKMKGLKTASFRSFLKGIYKLYNH